MNNKRLPQTIGIFFLMITISVTQAFAQVASGRQEKNSTSLNNSKRIYARNTSYSNGDADTNNGKTSSLIPIKTVRNLGLQVVAVDPKIIPYGSVILGKDKAGNDIVGVAVDTGGDVKNRKAARQHALAKGYSQNSPQYKAPVLDFYSKKGDIANAWDNFTVILYSGPGFKTEMSQSEKIAHLKAVRDKYLGKDIDRLLADNR